MNLKITANTLFTKHFLILDSGGVKFYDGTGFSGARRFGFDQIACILLSPDHKLSFQVSNEVFTIPTKPDNAQHKAVIDTLVQAVRHTAAAGT